MFAGYYCVIPSAKSPVEVTPSSDIRTAKAGRLAPGNDLYGLYALSLWLRVMWLAPPIERNPLHPTARMPELEV